MDSKKEKNRLSDIVLERVGLTGNLLSDPVFPSPEPVTRVPGHERPVGAGKVTDPEEYKRRFLVPAPKAAEWKTAYIDGRLPRRIAMLVRAAGYYSYLWANVLDNDAFEAFKEHGIFDKNTADLFRHNVLEKGDSEDPMVLYRNFRGAEPSLEPLLKNRGMK